MCAERHHLLTAVEGIDREPKALIHKIGICFINTQVERGDFYLGRGIDVPTKCNLDSFLKNYEATSKVISSPAPLCE